MKLKLPIIITPVFTILSLSHTHKISPGHKVKSINISPTITVTLYIHNGMIIAPILMQMTFMYYFNILCIVGTVVFSPTSVCQVKLDPV